MKQVQKIRLWLDHPKFGCGVRGFVAVIGYKWVTLIETATADSARVPLREFKTWRCTPQPIDRKLAKHLARAAKTYGRESAAVKEALSLLRQPGEKPPAADPALPPPRTGKPPRTVRTAPAPTHQLALL